MKNLLALAATGAWVLSSSIVLAQNAAGNPENGKRNFVKYGCYGCHGYDGHGGNGVKLAPKPIAAPAFIAYVRHPSPSGMPVFTAKVVSDTDLTDIWAYLKSIPEAPAAKDIPLLNQ